MKQLQQCELIASFAIPYLLQFELAFEFIFHQEALFKLLRYILMINERHKLIFFAIKNPKPPWIAGHEAMTWKLNWCIEAFNNGFELQNLIDAFKHITTHSRNKKTKQMQTRCWCKWKHMDRVWTALRPNQHKMKNFLLSEDNTEKIVQVFCWRPHTRGLLNPP